MRKILIARDPWAHEHQISDNHLTAEEEEKRLHTRETRWRKSETVRKSVRKIRRKRLLRDVSFSRAYVRTGLLIGVDKVEKLYWPRLAIVLCRDDEDDVIPEGG